MTKRISSMMVNAASALGKSAGLEFRRGGQNFRREAEIDSNRMKGGR
jgi:hypothetical protein